MLPMLPNQHRRGKTPEHQDINRNMGAQRDIEKTPKMERTDVLGGRVLKAKDHEAVHIETNATFVQYGVSFSVLCWYSFGRLFCELCIHDTHRTAACMRRDGSM